jgi:hypothetical protein
VFLHLQQILPFAFWIFLNLSQALNIKESSISFTKTLTFDCRIKTSFENLGSDTKGGAEVHQKGDHREFLKNSKPFCFLFCSTCLSPGQYFFLLIEK